MANKKSVKNKKALMNRDSLGGFTIIEVVLVLAIAGLIFMMVFIALPQLQRAQRDTQRRQNLSSFQSAVTQYQSNNNGKIPGQKAEDRVKCTSSLNLAELANTVPCRLIKTYLNAAGDTENHFVDPDGTPYDVSIVSNSTNLPMDTLDHTVYMVVQAKCDGETYTTTGAQPRDFAILYKLEGSGVYCSNN